MTLPKWTGKFHLAGTQKVGCQRSRVNGTDDTQALGSWYHQLHFHVRVRLQKLAQGQIKKYGTGFEFVFHFFLTKGPPLF